MKKVLSVLCMALLAGGMMFTSCNKTYTITVKAEPAEGGTVTGGGTFADQVTTVLTATPNAGYKFVQWQDGVKENPRTISVTGDETYIAHFEALPQHEAKITFQNNSWNAASAVGYDYTSEGYITFLFHKVANSTNDIYCQGFLETTPGTYDYENNLDIMHYRDPNYIYTDVDNVLGQGAGAQYWGWNTLTSTFTETITAVDLNALNISGTWSAQVGDVATYANTGDWGTTYPFTGKLTNAEWTMLQPSKGTNKVKINGPTRK